MRRRALHSERHNKEQEPGDQGRLRRPVVPRVEMGSRVIVNNDDIRDEALQMCDQYLVRRGGVNFPDCCVSAVEGA